MSLRNSVRFFVRTDVGLKRDHNEDQFLVDKSLGLFIVADGMGGHAAGEIASALAVRTIHEELTKNRDFIDDYDSGATGAAKVSVQNLLGLLDAAVQKAGMRIHEEAQRDVARRGMGTTLSLLLIAGQRGFIAHVGDSRIYLVRDGALHQITEDHNVYNELIKRGKLSREQIEKITHGKKNAITRTLGVYERVEVDTLSFELLAGDQLLLCSDGLHGYVQNDEELLSRIAEKDGDDATGSLIAFANSHGGKDNITTVLVRVRQDVKDAERAQRLARKRAVLSKMPLFSRMTARELMRVMQVTEARKYQDGEIILREGDEGDALFIVLSGQVSVTKSGAILTTLTQGEHFGEMALIRRQPRSATVSSVGPSEMLIIRRTDFFEILRTEHEMAVKLLWQFLNVLANRLDQTSKDLSTAREAMSHRGEDLFPVLDIAELEDDELEDVDGDDSRVTLPSINR